MKIEISVIFHLACFRSNFSLIDWWWWLRRWKQINNDRRYNVGYHLNWSEFSHSKNISNQNSVLYRQYFARITATKSYIIIMLIDDHIIQIGLDQSIDFFVVDYLWQWWWWWWSFCVLSTFIVVVFFHFHSIHIRLLLSLIFSFPFPFQFDICFKFFFIFLSNSIEWQLPIEIFFVSFFSYRWWWWE